MAHKLLGKKIGMTRRYDKSGHLIVCTVIQAEPNVVTQIKQKASDGYEAIQLGYGQVKGKDVEAKRRNVTKPLRGHFAKANVEPCRYLEEVRVESTDEFSVGQQLTVAQFNDEAFVDVRGVSKGKGFQGVIKRHNFKGGPAAHGSGFHRSGGSTGMRSTPGRCLPGTKKAGRMGGALVTSQSLPVIHIDEENNLLILKGTVPGAVGGLVAVTPAMKKKNKR